MDLDAHKLLNILYFWFVWFLGFYFVLFLGFFFHPELSPSYLYKTLNLSVSLVGFLSHMHSLIMPGCYEIFVMLTKQSSED